MSELAWSISYCIKGLWHHLAGGFLYVKVMCSYFQVQPPDLLQHRRLLPKMLSLPWAKPVSMCFCLTLRVDWANLMIQLDWSQENKPQETKRFSTRIAGIQHPYAIAWWTSSQIIAIYFYVWYTNRFLTNIYTQVWILEIRRCAQNEGMQQIIHSHPLDHCHTTMDLYRMLIWSGKVSCTVVKDAQHLRKTAHTKSS